MKYNASQLCQELGISEKYFSKNFCKIAQIRLKKGLLIERFKENGEWVYTLKKVNPQVIDKSFFTSRPIDNRFFEDEQWITSCVSNHIEVSNYGRVRDKISKQIYCGSINNDGYRVISIDNNKYKVHRIILQSFCPISNLSEMTVDHINGKRDDNRLENLRFVPKEQNTQLMLLERADLNKELTRIIQIYGYDQTLKILQEIQ